MSRNVGPLAGAAALALVVSAAAQDAGWHARPEAVASASKQQPGFNYDESQVRAYTLPDVLGGARTPEEWRARRAAILDLFRENVYGRSPGRPEHLDFTTVEEDPRAMDGAATRRRVSIKSRQGDRTHEFELLLFLPNAGANATAARVPVLLLINNRAASNTDPTRREKSGFWPAEQIVARGYGIAAIQYGQLAPDNKDRYREGVMTLFDGAGFGESPTWGAIAAWAWGASRAMDYLVTDPRVDESRVAVVGHSRGGKAALWTGAEDERFAMVVSNESGEGGAALSRRWFGETVERINTAFPHWFTATYKRFNGRETDLPIDQHMLLALVAPRALYVASADEDLWSDPRGEFLALVETSPVFALWSDPPIRATDIPPLDRPLVSGRRGYHIRTGIHNLTPYDWDRIADFGDRVWKK